MKNIALKIALIAGLTGCGPLSEGRSSVQLKDAALAAVSALTDSESTADAAPDAGLTREAIDAAPVKLLRLSLISGSATGILAEGGRNGSKVTWLSNAGFGFTFDEGLVVATRGTGGDLIGADVSAAIRSLDAGGNHTRTLDFLDSLDQIQQLIVQCQTVITGRETITIFERDYVTSVIEETCAGGDETFKNTYWRDEKGVIWQSRQWISSHAGYLGYQRL